MFIFYAFCKLAVSDCSTQSRTITVRNVWWPSF
nr:MAG TPA: hypothetical protein [Caudoviricetes sp.]